MNSERFITILKNSSYHQTTISLDRYNAFSEFIEALRSEKLRQLLLHIEGHLLEI